jgi:hypothetical protein
VWGGRSSDGKRTLSGSVREITPTWFEVQLTVTSTGADPLSGMVTFHLHPTFYPAVRTINAANGAATLTLQCFGAFTVGVLADSGVTKLELDLSELPDAPHWFKEH